LHIAASYARKLIHKCSYCNGPIMMGERIFRGNWFHNKKMFHIYWHFKCYWDQAVEYLDDHPFVSNHKGGKGRRELQLNSDEKRKRRTLIVYGSQIRAEMKKTVKFQIPGWREKLASLNTKYNGYATRLEKVGGVPRSWYR
jgi:hypothetical protein